jgi:hypothetical protein
MTIRKNHKKGIINNTNWFDTDGNLISAHGGGVSRFQGNYYLYGPGYAKNPGGYANFDDFLFMENKMKGYHNSDPKTWEPIFDGFNVYASKDLVNWQYGGKAYPPPERGWNRLHASHRPHVIYNDKTRKYVMFCYYYVYYPGCFLMVLTSGNPTGPFVKHSVVEVGSINGHLGDLNVFKDDHGRAYLIYDDTSFNIRIDRLTDDYLDSLKDGVVVMERKQEAPAMVKYKGKFLLAASGVDAWNPTETTLVMADTIMGPYTHKQAITENNTWNSQLTDMVYIEESDTVMVMFDQWFVPDKKNIDKSRYLWLPLEFNPESGKAKVKYLERWVPY